MVQIYSVQFYLRFHTRVLPRYDDGDEASATSRRSARLDAATSLPATNGWARSSPTDALSRWSLRRQPPRTPELRRGRGAVGQRGRLAEADGAHERRPARLLPGGEQRVPAGEELQDGDAEAPHVGGERVVAPAVRLRSNRSGLMYAAVPAYGGARWSPARGGAPWRCRSRRASPRRPCWRGGSPA